MATSAKKSAAKRTAARVAKAATAKAIKAAAKASVKPKAEKKPAPAPAPTKSGSIDEQKLFHQHLPMIAAQKAKVATAGSDLRNMYKRAKADGFDKYDFEIAMAIDTAEKEANQKAKIARTLTVAKWCGKGLGENLDLFLENDRTPASQIAFEEGKIASMQHQPAKPGYDPSTEQHREYMRGYHEVQAQIVKANIKPVDNTPKGSKPDGDAQAQPTRQPAPETPPETRPEAPKIDAPPPPPARNPMHATRADYLRHVELQRQEEEAAAAAREARAVASAAQPAALHQDPRGPMYMEPSSLNGSRPYFSGPVAAPDADEEEPSLFKRKASAPTA